MLIKRNAMGPQSGFTLIELIVVMMILAILVATAAPKFLNFQVDAREAALNGLKGALESGANLVYGKAAIKGIEKLDGGLDANGGTIGIEGVSTAFGYPTATMAGIGSAVVGLGNATINPDSDWETTVVESTKLKITFRNTKLVGCSVLYTPATSVTAPATSVVNFTGC